VAFLFGLHEFGQKMIEAAASHSTDPDKVRTELVQRPYLNDLDPWFQLALDGKSDTPSVRPPPDKLRRAASKVQVHPGVGDMTAIREREQESIEEYAEMVQRFVKLVYKFFPTVEDQREARMPYNLVDEGGLNGRDGGIFTGETLLHLAVVQHLDETVAWLLDNGADLNARAGGMFFQPNYIETFGIAKQKLMQKSAWLSDVGALLFDTGSQREKNSWGGTCYYGEYPLSFAASVGDVHICHLLDCKARDLLIDGLQHLQDNQVNHVGDSGNIPYSAKFLASLYVEMGGSQADADKGGDDSDMHQSINAVNINGEVEKLLYVFRNRCDSRGNTALHMAVRHKKMAVIDWLLQNGARPSLRVLNEDNLTPLTLAVRAGDPVLFQHMLSQLEINVWKFGSASMVVTPLEQVDTFLISSGERSTLWKSNTFKKKRGDLQKQPEATHGNMLSQLKGKVKDTVKKGHDAAEHATNMAKEAAHTAANSTKHAAMGIGHLAKTSIMGGLHGVKGATLGAGHVLTTGKIDFDLAAHKDFFKMVVASAAESTATLATVVQDGVKLFTKKSNGGGEVKLFDLQYEFSSVLDDYCTSLFARNCSE
jgi:ankyrin repeat protein